MKISHLGYLPDSVLAAGSSLFRIQWSRAGSSTVVRGPLKLAPPSAALGRFDIRDELVAYFAAAPETAAYETLVRRETQLLSLSRLRDRRLLTVHTQAPLRLADLRPHVTTFPVLQSLRYTETRELAEDIRAQGFDGIVFASAQQSGMDCYVLYESALPVLRKAVAPVALMDKIGRVHICIATAVRGSRVPVAM